jgi:hypothetical protein
MPYYRPFWGFSAITFTLAYGGLWFNPTGIRKNGKFSQNLQKQPKYKGRGLFIFKKTAEIEDDVVQESKFLNNARSLLRLWIFAPLCAAKIPIVRLLRTFGSSAACKVKNRLIGNFLRFYARSATNC